MSSENPKQENDAENTEEGHGAAAKGAERSFFDLENVDHEIVKKFKPEFIAMGGEHIVYSIPEHPDVVAKVNILSVRRILHENRRALQRPDALTDGAKRYMDNFLHEEAEKYQGVRAYFGAEHAPNQKKFLLKIPITKNILKAIGEESSGELAEVWGVVMIQKRAELEGPDHFSLATNGYPEQRDIPGGVYQAATMCLLYGDEYSGLSGKEALLELLGEGGGDLKNLIAAAEQDAKLRVMLKDLVEKLIVYFEKTGAIFDVVGKDNIAIMKEGGVWTYKFVDAIYPEGVDVSADARNAIVKLARKEEITDVERNEVLNTINFVRTMNGLAEFLGSEKRINIIPDEVWDGESNFSYVDFQKTLKEED
ncbi:MAG: hypothetical protein Q7R85_00285 [bacterium]|nr:hypothetical protein [bacterium]